MTDGWKAMRNAPRLSPCKNCPKRAMVCHSECDAYLRYREVCEGIRKKTLLKCDVQQAIGDAMKRLPGKRRI